MTVKNYSFGMLFLFLLVFIIGSAATDKKNEPANTTEEDNTMAEQIESFIKSEPNLKGALTGISIRSAKNGEKIYDHMGDVRLRPASNMKLLTAASALSVLGENHTFSTELVKSGSINGGTLSGDLFLKGKGDPTLLPADFDNFAKKIRESGINVIKGDIVGDDTWYDDVRLSPDLIWSDEHWYYGAQISALTASPDKDYDAGTVIVEVSPGSKGEKPEITVSPETNYIEVKNTALTSEPSVEEDLTLKRVHGENTITIEGTIPAESTTIKEWMTVWEPTGYAMELFQLSLQKQGITWEGKVKTGSAPDNAEVLYSYESMPLSEMLVPFMKLSNNTIAEILVKEMGKVVHGEGSWEKGLEVVETELAKMGINIDTLMIRDGSGISHATLIPPNEISKLLYTVQNQSWFDSYLHSLPIAGKGDRMTVGTLRSRMEDKNIQAKTGTIYGVSTLSGMVESESGESLIFSIMLNNLLDEEDGPEIEDKIVEIIANQ
ncbi:D-alanyl-D-alanine carboxypeptidase / D-alanyl-D-alanine-endopeptidase (penicillin-binding protein 4) [Virgibacillus subterraneus]|uniref:D-alanyl-D-alanine carboxypeptidase / D-alanyl-D-alanine-endopeptidase (Penicillin-binding protein 4) n=1 Tax=Virgibacillus subterraneus TaxID=621109 RepID=A0A1H9HRX2_9BACI|nr:D-alanyl-D-alanine carboxypeptidase/D-alanyl-D-alanine-endopeptidase [Virgibacillus subterraneus]SEQ65099.1 D-alanyl-D-alanine carboxypeptidase / D-alanyl-D-alanine-endopeptidase (penicillin-binding protein 4) [Virgibacillus subterraneus]